MVSYCFQSNITLGLTCCSNSMGTWYVQRIRGRTSPSFRGIQGQAAEALICRNRSPAQLVLKFIQVFASTSSRADWKAIFRNGRRRCLEQIGGCGVVHAARTGERGPDWRFNHRRRRSAGLLSPYRSGNRSHLVVSTVNIVHRLFHVLDS